jgi:glycerol-3-phosphate cytidylyltransferase-like family protein
MESFNFENIEETPEESEFKGIFLEIVSLTFSPKSQWRFYAKSHIDYVGKAIIEAKLEDLTFFQKVKSHDYIFEDGDILRCDLKMLKYEEPQKNKFFVTHVHSKVNKENYDEQTLL